MFNTLYNAAATTLGYLSQAFSPNMVPMHATQVGVNTRILKAWQAEVEDSLPLIGDRPLKGALLSQDLSAVSPDEGPTALQLACKRNDLTTVKLVMTSIRAKGLDAGAYIDKANAGTTPAIVSAIYNGNPELLKYLVSMGAQIVDQENPELAVMYKGYDLYEEALSTGNPELAVPFAEKGLITRSELSPEAESICRQAHHRTLDDNGHNALHAAIVNNGEELDLVLGQIGNVDLPTHDGVSPLMLACQNGASQATLTKLLTAGAVDAEAWKQHADMLWKAKAYTSVKGKSLLEHACLKGDVETVYYCLAAGAPIALLLDEKGNIKKGCRTTFKKVALARSKKYGGSFLIHMAAKRGDATLARHLLANSPKGQVLEKNDDGWSASALAMHSSCPSTKALLVEHIPASELNNVSSTRQKAYEANKTSAEGYTPLQDACENGDLAEIERLLKAGADPNAANAKLGASPLESAIKTAPTDSEAHAMVLTLMNAGAKPDAGALARACVDGKTETRDLLLNAGADWMAIVNSRYVTPDMLPETIEGTSLPLLAAKAGRLDIIPKLMSEDVMKAKDGNGNTLLHLYVKELNLRIANGNQKGIERKVLKSPEGQFLNVLLRDPNASAYVANNSGRLPQELTSYKGLQGMLHAANPRVDLLVKNYAVDPSARENLERLCDLSNAPILAEELAPHIAELYTSGQHDIFWALVRNLQSNGVYIGAVQNAEGEPMLCALALKNGSEEDFRALLANGLHDGNALYLSKAVRELGIRTAAELRAATESDEESDGTSESSDNSNVAAANSRVDLLVKNYGVDLNASEALKRLCDLSDAPIFLAEELAPRIAELYSSSQRDFFWLLSIALELKSKGVDIGAVKNAAGAPMLCALALEKEQEDDFLALISHGFHGYTPQELSKFCADFFYRGADFDDLEILVEAGAEDLRSISLKGKLEEEPEAQAYTEAVRAEVMATNAAAAAASIERSVDPQEAFVNAVRKNDSRGVIKLHAQFPEIDLNQEVMVGSGQTAMHYACAHWGTDDGKKMIATLIRLKANRNIVDNSRRTPLDMITHERPGKDALIGKLWRTYGMRTYQQLRANDLRADSIFDNPLI